MRVLYLLPEAPYPPDRGPRNHAYGLLRSAAEHIECEVIGFYRGDEGIKRWQKLQQALPQVRIRHLFAEVVDGVALVHGVQLLAGVTPLVLRHYRSRAFGRALTRLLSEEPYDVVHVDQFKLAHYGAYCGNTPRILVPHDAYSLAYFRAMETTKSVVKKGLALYLYLAFSRLEKRVYPHYDLVCPVSSVDACWLNRRVRAISTEVLEIPVAEDYFTRSIVETAKPNEPHVICAGSFTDGWVAEEMIQFLEDALPSIRRAIPNVKFTLWGPGLSPAFQSLLKRLPNVEHVAWVEDYIGMLKSASVYVYPTRCVSGLQTKVQQAMALGVTVVGRPETLLPLYVRSGEHAYICDTAAAMGEAVIRVLQDEDSHRRMGNAGSQHIHRHFSLDTIRSRLTEVYGKVTRKTV